MPVDRFIIQALECHLAHTPANLAESIRYSLLAPGKRIRPRLALECGRMVGLPDEAALCAGAAIEMIHCFTLIHDDLPCLDDDDFRRGRPSNHKAHGEGLALLAGDALIGLAIDALLDAEVAPAFLREAMRTFSEAIGPRGVIGGQAAEILLNLNSSLAELSQMHALKTGALFRAALLMPADLAGLALDEKPRQAIGQFADQLGLAFQIVDDLEDDAQDVKGPAAKPSASGSDSPFTSILHYLDAPTARCQTAESLLMTMESLKTVFGSSAGPLLSIAEELRGSLQ